MSELHEIEQLKAQHAELESALVNEERKALPDELSIARIKKQKLMIKDEIARREHV